MNHGSDPRGVGTHVPEVARQTPYPLGKHVYSLIVYSWIFENKRAAFVTVDEDICIIKDILNYSISHATDVQDPCPSLQEVSIFTAVKGCVLWLVLSSDDLIFFVLYIFMYIIYEKIETSFYNSVHQSERLLIFLATSYMLVKDDDNLFNY